MFDILGKESKFDKYAEIAANDYLNNEVPLNDSIVKLAEEKELNPEQIKRVVEAANVKVFQKHFGDDDREGHKDVDFDVADPKVIIRKIYIIKKDSGSSDDHESSPMDFFKDLSKDNFSDRTQDDVEDLPDEKKKLDRPTLVIRIKSAKSNLEKEAYAISEQYVEKVAEVAKAFRRSDAEPQSFYNFCKEAMEHKGEAILPILNSIATEARKEVPNFEEDGGLSKIAGFPSRDIEALTALEKIAADYDRHAKAAELAQEQLDEMDS